MKTNKNNRKVLLILPSFQIKFLKFLFLLTVLICSLFYIAIYFFISYWHGLGVDAGLESNHVFFDFLEQMKITLGYVLVGVIAMTTLLSTIIGLYMSNKMAGPIYNILRYFQDLSVNGWVRPITFRSNDYFVELMEVLNQFLEKQGIAKQNLSIKERNENK